MSNFRTVVSVGPSPQKIRIKDQILTIGSCFADAIGNRMEAYRLRVLANPFGNLYNPYSIHKALRFSVYNELPHDHTFLQREGRWFNYDFHSEISGADKHVLFARLNDIAGTAHHQLASAEWLLITYGTAWVYERNDTGEIVANCQKMPGSLFTKSLLKQDAIVESFEGIYKELKRLNPDIKIILTVSPVRHLKDTLALNSVSKSILRSACHDIAIAFPDVDYFPSYEIMIDDLRDYRFYKADMIHPSDVAEDYIWEKFVERYFSNDLKSFLPQWKEILTAIHHKPFHPSSAAHQSFLKDTLRRLESLKETIDVTNELALINSQIKE